MAINFKFDLESLVKDRITGLQGIILGRTEYATGCIQYGISPQEVNKDGKINNWEWFDETRLLLVTEEKKVLKAMGGPSPSAPQA